jgi:hypothetical protein
MWRYNSDGIDVCTSQDVSITDCFVRSFDDAIVIKGLIRKRKSDTAAVVEGPTNVKNIQVSNCVIWCDWGRALEIGAETRVDSIGRILFKDCDVIHYVQYAMDIQNGDRGLVHDVKYKNIRVEEPIVQQAVLCTTMYLMERLGTVIGLVINNDYYSRDSLRGSISDISYKDISFNASVFPRSIVWGFDEQHLVRNVTIENFTINGRRVTSLEDGNIQLKSAFNKNIVIK